MASLFLCKQPNGTLIMNLPRNELRGVFAGHGEFGGNGAVCPHCGVYAAFANAGVVNWPGTPARFTKYLAADIVLSRCTNCAWGLVGIHYRVQKTAAVQGELIYPNSVSWPDRAPDGLPEPIKRAYDEARAVVGISAMATAVLARRCIQHVIRAKVGITKRTLFDEIAEAIKRPELTMATRDALDHVRQIGNWGAHPIKEADESETIIEVTEEDASYTLEVVELLFNDLFVVPARVAQMQKRVKGT